MIDRDIHLTNSNILTHNWDPVNTQETLIVDNKVIHIVPNTKQSGNWPRELHIAGATMRELNILNGHGQAMLKMGNDLHEEIKSLPSTNLTQYHEKISAYQGIINLFFKHHKFLANTAKTLHSKFHEGMKPLFSTAVDKIMLDLFLEHSDNSIIREKLIKSFVLNDVSRELLKRFLDAKKENNDTLIQLMNTLYDIRNCQKNSAMLRESLVAYEQRVSAQSRNMITRIIKVREPQEFIIGNYSHQNQHYNISVNMVINNQYNWNKWLTKNPLGNLVFKSRCVNCARIKAGIEATVTWVQRDYPVLVRGVNNGLEPTAIGINYPKLFATNMAQIPCVDPTLFVKKERCIENNHVHMSRLYQALTEWMQYYYFDQIVFYATEMDAPYLYTFGFTNESSALSKKTERLVLKALEKGKPYMRANGSSEMRHLPLIPFVLKKNDICTAKIYNFESKNVTSCAELILKARVLEENKLPLLPPMISGISYLPYKNMMNMLRHREMFQSNEKSPVGIKAVPVDYHALKNPIERMAYAQVGDGDLEEENIILSHKKSLKIKRF